MRATEQVLVVSCTYKIEGLNVPARWVFSTHGWVPLGPLGI